MKRKKIISTITSTIMIGAIGITTAFATSPGTTSDPLVSKSYVDDKISQIMTVLEGSNKGTGTIDTNDFASKSYVDSQLNQFMTRINTGELILENTLSESERTELIEDIIKNLNVLGIEGNTELVETKSSYVPVNAIYGQTILGGEGCEIILRSGTSVALVPGQEGIVNATSGANLNNNEEIYKDNIIIVPRNDGRGVKVTSDEAWFIIKGNYTVK